jgi:hypothetical protein
MSTNASKMLRGEGRQVAVDALTQVADRDREDSRFSATSIRRIVDIAWNNQSRDEQRQQARAELQEVINDEIRARKGRQQ